MERFDRKAHPELRTALLRALAPLTSTSPGDHAHLEVDGAAAIAHCTYERECIRKLRIDEPTLVIVCSGVKELWRGDLVESYGSGSVILLPAGTVVDCVNVPDDSSGRFETLCLRIGPSLRRELRRRTASTRRPKAASGIARPIAPDGELVEAFARAVHSIAAPSRHALALHRIVEVLLLIAPRIPADDLETASMGERVARLMMSDPAARWTVERLSRALGMSPSTLRRKLGREGRSFRRELLAVRMETARELLESSNASVTAAAEAAGYVSRSHFARRFRATVGVLPRAARAGALAMRQGTRRGV